MSKGMMQDFTGTLEESSRQRTGAQPWVQAILDSAAELSSLSRGIRQQERSARDITDLLWEADAGDKPRQGVEPCRRAVENLLARVNDFLDFSNVESGRFELEKADFDIISLLDHAMARVGPKAQARNVTLHSVLTPGISRALAGDPLRLRRIFAHLLNSAVESAHLPSSAVDSAQSAEIALTATSDPANSSLLRFAVTGLRAAPEPGPGFGLCRLLLRQMGGDLRLHSEPDGRCSFLFEVLLAPGGQDANDSPVERKASPRTPAEPTVTPLRILIAEDSEDCRFLLQEFLKKGPYAITFAENGREAVEAALSKPFGLILMDIQMPVMDGLTATRIIREAEQEAGRSPTPLLALTANARKADMELSLAAGCNAHVLKPISKTGLLNAIEKHSPPQSSPPKSTLPEIDSSDSLEAPAHACTLSTTNEGARPLGLFEPNELGSFRS